MKNVLIAMDGSKQSVFAFNRKYMFFLLIYNHCSDCKSYVQLLCEKNGGLNGQYTGWFDCLKNSKNIHDSRR